MDCCAETAVDGRPPDHTGEAIAAARSLEQPLEATSEDLARDLPAVGSASLLRLRELWRRNREGDLSVPAFWPQALSAWFWPLLLALALSLLSLPLLLGRGNKPAPAVVVEQPLAVEQQLQQAFEPPRPQPEPSSSR